MCEDDRTTLADGLTMVLYTCSGRLQILTTQVNDSAGFQHGHRIAKVVTSYCDQPRSLRGCSPRSDANNSALVVKESYFLSMLVRLMMALLQSPQHTLAHQEECSCCCSVVCESACL